MKNNTDLLGTSDPTLLRFNAFRKSMRLLDFTAQAARDKTEIRGVRWNYFWSCL
jgi:hypothetical protein